MTEARLFCLVRFLGRGPLDGIVVHHQTRLFVLRRLEMLLYQLGCNADDVLALPVLDQVQRLQGGNDITLSDARHCAQVLHKVND